MAKLYGRDYTRQELLERIGSIYQIAGVKEVRFADGYEDGVKAYLLKTGSGFNFTVVPGRGMDISNADWCGKSLSWISSTGEVAPQFYEPEGIKWLRNFGGGLLVTCGLTQVGSPTVDNGQELGLHGRYSNIPAYNISYGSEWQGDDYVMWVQGKVREASVFGENLVLTRRISTKLGENRLWIDDSVENEGFESTPLMILYHCNIGFPVVDVDSQLLSPTQSIAPRDAGVSTDEYDEFDPPTPGFTERVYYHDMATAKDGKVTAALVNRNIPGGLGFYIRYNKSELPFFTEWKMNGQGIYVVGMEPGNCHPEGRVREREMGSLQMIEPGEVRKYSLELGALTSESEIAEIEDLINSTPGI